MNDIELLSPAGSFETALAAFAAGADAVYLGLDAFSARADAVNFTDAQLRDLLAAAHREGSGRKVYFMRPSILREATPASRSCSRWSSRRRSRMEKGSDRVPAASV